MLSGESKEVIHSGSTVIPSEVEDVIASRAAVSEVSVLGLPDVEWARSSSPPWIGRLHRPVHDFTNV